MQTHNPELDPYLQAMADCKRAQQEIVRLRTILNKLDERINIALQNKDHEGGALAIRQAFDHYTLNT